jgi:spectinomycin phosphotransferase
VIPDGSVGSKPGCIIALPLGLHPNQGDIGHRQGAVFRALLRSWQSRIGPALTCYGTVVAVDTPAPAIFDDGDLLRTTSVRWDLEVDEFRYVPKGAGSYHWIAENAGDPKYFITVDDLDTKPWIDGGRDLTFAGLGAAYEAAWTLDHEAGLASVVAPLRCPTGSIIDRIADQYSVVVFPFVDGRTGTWGEPLRDWDKTTLLQTLASLHQTSLRSGFRIARRSLDLPERGSLTATLSELDRPWKGGPLAESARHALAAHAHRVTDWLDQLDRLAEQLTAQGGVEVLTHGEPHPGNLIRTAGGLRLIDWDTVAVAYPERDLWMLDDRSEGSFAQYEDLTGRSISNAAISFYRLAWTLSDIASFAETLRAPHEEDRSVREKWNEFQLLLGGATSAPFRAS